MKDAIRNALQTLDPQWVNERKWRKGVVVIDGDTVWGFIPYDVFVTTRFNENDEALNIVEASGGGKHLAILLIRDEVQLFLITL